MSKWSPMKFQCKKCHQVIYALVPGDVDTCICWASSVTKCDSMIMSRMFDKTKYIDDEEVSREIKRNVYSTNLEGIGVLQTKDRCLIFGDSDLVEMIND